ncbi:MAG: type II toxin-antitoxin system prevent-host-death family antitoxin [Candidatus Omnitrophica bacterium]|nr:type II toxin-antitoxin system prevent-host-death family antitoxin [Candidatus Omnitrophota bacterium]
MIATIRQLRSSTKEILNTVSRGGTVWVTNRGKACAKIVPVMADKQSHKDEAFGMWRDRKDIRSVRSYVRRMRKWRRAD